jgi:hypothetical protein
MSSQQANPRTTTARATPTRRPAPDEPPKCPSRFGYVRCPGCAEYWTGLRWGDACPECGCVRLHEGNWFPWGEE